jgi:hypothetical protein
MNRKIKRRRSNAITTTITPSSSGTSVTPSMLKFRSTPEDTHRSHTLRVYLQSLDSMARIIHVNRHQQMPGLTRGGELLAHHASLEPS